MKTIRPYLVTGLLALALPLAMAFAKEKEDKKAPAVGSIRPEGKIKPADLPALAKVSFAAALNTALAAAPGAVIKAELEVEDGNLMYSFEIVGTNHKVKEVEIDAGNGKVLDLDED